MAGIPAGYLLPLCEVPRGYNNQESIGRPGLVLAGSEIFGLCIAFDFEVPIGGAVYPVPHPSVSDQPHRVLVADLAVEVKSELPPVHDEYVFDWVSPACQGRTLNGFSVKRDHRCVIPFGEHKSALCRV